jgi:hypothetical protein
MRHKLCIICLERFVEIALEKIRIFVLIYRPMNSLAGGFVPFPKV